MAVVLIHAPDNFATEQLEGLARVCERTALPCALAAVDSTKIPGLLAMFGVVQTPYLLIFRDRGALYAEPVQPTAPGLEALLARMQQLDMDEVHAEIEAQRQAQEALLMRRACPTVRSGPARSRK
ncbi:MAG: hypothetical protein EXR36_03375 [Betaproteobacteria bacterium]|nr:hypothetical protein [Betaproteobacteria bacterium]